MDTSKQYIQMCEALPGEMHYLLGFDNGDRRRFPRLDNLLELSGQKWDDFFQNCIDWKTDLEDPEIKSAEQAGLIMIMYENYGMIWTGETWEAGEY